MSDVPYNSALRDDRLAAVHEQLAAGIEALVSGEDWKKMLEVAARFHRYSLNNIMLIGLQMPDATRVAGYRAWQTLGHQVRRGEHGLAILAPVLRRVHEDSEQPRQQDGEAEPAGRQVLAGFRLTKVFDISQTDGPPLPDVLPTTLSGEAPAALYEGLAAQVAAAGFSLERKDCSPANGRTDFVARAVTVRPDCSPAQAAKTLAHELGHVLLHDEDKFVGFGGFSCRGLAEVEAESVAYLVCESAGLSTGEYSFPYVARWANGDVTLVRSAAERALGAARTITTSLGLVAEPTSPTTDAVLARSRHSSVEASNAPARQAPERSLANAPRETARSGLR